MTSKAAFTTRIFQYHNDGSGRDSYISSNNAGFYKEYRIINCSQFPEKISGIKSMYNPVFSKPIGRYFCDGNGRDVYIFKQNSRNLDLRTTGVDLPSILRNDNFVMNGAKTFKQNPDISDKIKNDRNRIIEQNVVKRIFYGNAKGLSERRMSPKVKFNKKALYLKDMNNLNDSIKLKDRFSYYYKSRPTLTEENFIKGVHTLANFNCRYKC